MAGQLDKNTFSLLLAKVLIVNADLKQNNIRFEDNPDRVPAALFTFIFPTVLEKLSNSYPEIGTLYTEFMQHIRTDTTFPNAFVFVLDTIIDSHIAEKNPTFLNDTRAKVLIVSILANCYAYDDIASVAKSYFDYLEQFEVTGIHELVLLSTAMYSYNYEGDFCELVCNKFVQLKEEGFGEDIEEIKRIPVNRTRNLSGCSILANECGVVDNIMNTTSYAPGSLNDWRQKQGPNTWLEWLGDNEMSWATQCNSSLWDIINSGFRAVKPSLDGDGEVFGKMRDIYKATLKLAHKVAENCNKPFDVSIVGKVSRSRTVYVDVPYEVKVGLFKKETRYRKEPKTETIIENKQIIFNGWLLEHFERIEEDNDKMSWDYCVGSDGQFYVITSMYDNSNGTMEYKVSEMLPNFESFFRIAKQNTFVSVSHGWMGALDTVAIKPYNERRYSTYLGDERYTFDFPLQLNSREEYPFPEVGDGIKTRLKLLAE